MFRERLCISLEILFGMNDQKPIETGTGHLPLLRSSMLSH